MEKILLSFSLLFLFAMSIQGCDQNNTGPADNESALFDMQEALHDPDLDDAVVGVSVSQRGDCNGRIGNFVWADHDCDGYQDCHRGNPPEMGIPGVEIRLLDADTGELLATTYTDSSGRYKFRDLCMGSYLVEVVPPDGWVLTTPNQGGDPFKDSNPNPSLVVLTDNNPIDKSIDFGFCERTGGDQGCTPGYWKQDQHFDSWPAPYVPTMLFSDVFESAFPGKTLVDVLALGGGGLNALGRHTVAAMLNGASGGVNYEFSDSEVIDMFNDVYPGTAGDYEGLKDLFEYNNELGCPLN